MRLFDKNGNDVTSTFLYQPNLLMNGNFQIWQRGETFTTPTDSEGFYYTSDRWCVYKSTEKSFNIKKGENGGIVLTKGLFQFLETPLVEGEKYTISANIDNVIYIYTFDGGSYSENDYFKYNKYINGYEYIRISANKDESERTIYWCKLEPGSTATPCVPRLRAEDVSLCQRYCVLKPNQASMRRVASVGSQMMYVIFSLPTAIRTFPNVTLRNNAVSWRTNDGTLNETEVTVNVASFSSNEVVLLLNGSFGSPIWQIAMVEGLEVLIDADIY